MGQIRKDYTLHQKLDLIIALLRQPASKAVVQTDWTQLPVTLTVHHVAAIYGLTWRTVTRKIGRREIAQPFADKPWRWRRSDVRAHYERLSLHATRRNRTSVA